MTQEDIEKIRFAAQLHGELDKYVYLREDSEGKYIEYAFIEGAPHDNRCLSWYDSYQEEAYIRNHWTRGLSWKEEREYLSKLKKKRDDRVGGLFRLSSFTCGYEENQERELEEAKESWEMNKEYHNGEPFVPEDHICKVGKLFKLSSFTCGYEENQERRLEETKESWEMNKEYHNGEPFVPEDHICRVGNPANRCRDTHCKYWTYKEPVKCACWYLSEPDIPKYVNVPIDLAMKSIKLDSN